VTPIISDNSAKGDTPRLPRDTLGELILATAAREIQDKDMVFVGMRLPLIAFVGAKKTHAPDAIGLFENAMANLPNIAVRGPKGRARLPGSGGACEIASLAHRFVVLLKHSKARLPERVSFLNEPRQRRRSGLANGCRTSPGGPAAVITTKAVLRFGEDGQAYPAPRIASHSQLRHQTILDHLNTDGMRFSRKLEL
jgi:glutaconate CoA-transferase subunit B